MNILEQLVNIITKHKIRATEIMGHPEGRNANSYYQRFYEAIAQNKFKTEDEYAAYLGKGDAKSPEFKRLKNDLEKRLVNHIFLIDMKKTEFSEQYQAFYNAWKYLAASKILHSMGSRNSAIKIVKKAHKFAMKYDHTDVALETSRKLKEHYATFMGDKKKYAELKVLVEKYSEIQKAEMLAEDYYQSLMIHYAKSAATKVFIQDMAMGYLKNLQPYVEKYKVYWLQLYYYKIGIMQFLSVNDYQQAVKFCEEAIRYFMNKPYKIKGAIAGFNHQLLACYTQLEEYDKAEMTLQKSIEFLPSGSSNWFVNKELHFLLLLHTQQYTKAYQTYIEVTQHQQFKNLFVARKEQWKIYEAYLEYLVAKGRIKPTGTTKKKKFRLSRFINDLTLASQDKRGQQIPMMVIQIAFLVHQKQYFEVYEQVAAIEKYNSRYLKKDDTYRSSCFIRMLMQLPKGEYQQSKVRKKARKYLRMMQKVPTKVAGQTHELEILPYPLLWEMMVEDLPVDKPALG